MKTPVFFCILMFQIPVFSQVLNGNFEAVKPNLLAYNWGINFSIPVSINTETGESTSDMIWYGSCIPSMCNATTEASEGQFGLEISNAFNATQNSVIKGGAILFWDSTQDSPGWNPGVPLQGNEAIDWVSFYYKFLPVGNEIAQFNLVITNENSQEMSVAQYDLFPTTDSNFHFVSIPVVPIEAGIPSHLHIEFTMAKEGTIPLFGSRLVIDDIRTGSLLHNPAFQIQQFSIYPTQVQKEINLKWTNNSSTTQAYQITNQAGQICLSGELYSTQNTLNVSNLASGIYFFTIGNTTRKFVKIE